MKNGAFLSIALLSALAVAGCSAGSTTFISPSPNPRGTLPPVLGGSAPQHLYVTIGSGTADASVNVFNATASGQAQPVRSFTSLIPIEFSQPSLGVAFDSHGNAWVKSSTAILEFAPNASGSVMPTGAIGGPDVPIQNVGTAAFDSQGNLYVPDYSPPYSVVPAHSSIDIFASGASGNQPPVRSISGSATQLDFPLAVAIDSKGNIYVANAGPNTGGPSVTVYAAGAGGNAAPIHRIAGSNTDFGAEEVLDIAIDSNDNLYVASGGIEEFPYGSDGNVAPTYSIQPGSTTGFTLPIAVAIGSDGTIYVANYNGQILAFSTMGFGPPSRSFTAAPSASIMGMRLGP